MLKVRSLISEGIIDGKVNGVAEISVSNTSELATTDGNTVFTDGSIAWVIRTGAFYGLDGGTWYKQDGSGETI